MPSQQRVAIDSSPGLHGIFDTINASLAADDPRVRLPREFYDNRARAAMEQVLLDEEYAGYRESDEYRRLGIGDLLGQLSRSMAAKAGRMQQGPDLALYACHDSTLAASLTALDAWGEKGWEWPPYTSTLAVELFRETELRQGEGESESDVGRHFVRLRYNGKPMRIASCQLPERPWGAEGGFCTLVGCMLSWVFCLC